MTAILNVALTRTDGHLMSREIPVSFEEENSSPLLVSRNVDFKVLLEGKVSGARVNGVNCDAKFKFRNCRSGVVREGDTIWFEILILRKEAYDNNSLGR